MNTFIVYYEHKAQEKSIEFFSRTDVEMFIMYLCLGYYESQHKELNMKLQPFFLSLTEGNKLAFDLGSTGASVMRVINNRVDTTNFWILNNRLPQ